MRKLAASLFGGLALVAIASAARSPAPPTDPWRAPFSALPPDRGGITSPGVLPAPPALFFTDIESGPNTGGQDNLGAFISIYGEGFGATRGASTVTIGGHEVARYVQWGANNAPARSLDLIVVQPGSAVTAGNIVVTVDGQASNPLTFTVRSGGIYFVATTGDDSHAGSYAQPWRTIVHAKNTIAPGDIIYVRDGVTATLEENYSAAVSIEASGSISLPKALIAYPGATATIGSTGLEFGLRVPNIDIAVTDWVIAKLVLRGQVEAADIGGSGSSRWHVIGNDISCPIGDGQTGCFTASLASHIKFLGNHVYGISTQGSQPSKQYHAVYFTTDTNHVEVGWNHLHDNATCRALQFHSSPLNATTGYNQYDLIVHDNLIHGDVCDGINFATVNPAQGPVRAYNNIIYNVGRGPAPPDGDANYAGIYVAGATNTGADGTGTVEVFNNTFYDCGARLNGDAGAVGRGPGSTDLWLSLRHNVVYAVNGETYLSPSSNTAVITGTHNLWFGGGPAPAFLLNNLNLDPKFAALPIRDFRYQLDSPAIDAAGVTLVDHDFAGLHRPIGLAADLGAHEFLTVTAVFTPAAFLPLVVR